MVKHIAPRILTLFVLSLALLILSTDPALAQSKSVVVRSRNGDITIQANGNLDFDEEWVVQFIGGSFSYAFRCIEQGKYDAIRNWQVSQNGIEFSQSSSGRAGTFELYTEENKDCIKWHFAPTTSATRNFNLRYTVQGGLRIYPGGDQFFWNFIESDRQYTINSSQVTLHIPGNTDKSLIKAAAGENLAAQDGSTQVIDGNTVIFTGKNFTPGDLWTLRAQFPHGIVDAQPSNWQTSLDQRDALAPIVGFGALMLSLIALIGGGLGLYLLWYTQGRDKPTGLVAEFYPTPPTDDPPGVAGVLLDERADMQDIVATIVDLARRGVLRMIEKSEPGFLGIGTKRDFTFERADNETGLREYEETLIQKMFGARDSIDLDDLKEKFYKYLPEIKKEMYQEVVRAGYYSSSPQAARTRYSVLGVGGLVVLGCIGFALFGALIDISPLAFCPLVAFGLLGVALIVLAQFMPKRTNAGGTAFAKWNAFKRYLANIEKYANVAEAKDQFDKYLPYAIAFGLEHSWVNKFAAVDTPAPPWYFPYGGYYGGRRYTGATLSAGEQAPSGGSGRMPSLNEASAAGFRGLNAMSDGLFSMLNTTSSVFTSAPSSSGGGGGGWSGGGGGFSGGGGGGSSGFG
ncbi:MAG: DUF2207 domain-containing protein [Chloroflexi bacterium]|nr:DUF2207 domain-containing protein [Chloroflexota bacterium]